MAGNPHPVFQDGVAVEKANARTYMPLRLGNPDALRALDGSTFWLCYIQTLLAFFYRDTSDTTSEDNGSSIIVDGNGGIWKVISSGAGLAINAAGPVASRGSFDGEDPGFTYFGTDTELLYVRKNAGGWSDGTEVTGPQGEPGNDGADGRNFQPDQVVPNLAGRAAYDGEAKNIAVLVESDSSNSDLPTLYFKESVTSGDWSNGFTFEGGGGDVAGDTHAAASKTAPADADELPLVDSDASNVLKKLTWANLKSNFATTAQGTKADSALQGAFGFRNRLINPNGKVWQRLNSGAAAITDGTYAFDRWYGLTQSAGITASQITNAENGTPYMMRLSQANSTAQRFGIAQVIESANILDVRGRDVALSARVRMSASTTLRYAIIEWTGTADTVTKDVVNSWTSTTFTPGNFFNSTSLAVTATGSIALTANTLASVNLTGTVSGSANNLIAFFWTDSTQAQNVTLDIGKVQLEIGTTATPLAVRSATEDLNDCLRYYFSSDNGSYIVPASTNVASQFKVRMRSVPTITATPNAGTFSVNGVSVDAMFGSCTALAAVAIVANAEL